MMYLFSRGKYIIIQLGGGPPPEETDDEVEYSIQMPMNPTPRGGLFWLPPTILPSVGPSIVVSSFGVSKLLCNSYFKYHLLLLNY